jgi:NitT/TauT family transport system permease protein
VRRTGVLLLGLVAWELAARLHWLDPLLFPPPLEVAAVLMGLFRSGGFWGHVRTTLLEAFLGLASGVLTGGLLGIGAAIFAPVAEVLEPVMALLNAIPRVILAPLFVIWFGIGVASKVALGFLLVCVVMFFAVYTGIREVDPRLVDRVRTLGGRSLDVLREVYLPSLAAWLLSGLKVAVGFAFTGAVVGEFVAASRGIGYLLSFAQSTYNARLTLALVLLVVGVILGLFGLSTALERRWLRWKPEYHRAPSPVPSTAPSTPSAPAARGVRPVERE